MPRIVAALAIAAALIIGVFIIKNKSSVATNRTSLIAEQIQNANQSSLDAYAKELEASGVASDTSIVLPPPTNNTSTTDISYTPTTATDKLAQNIFEQYVGIKQSGVDVSNDVASQIADNVLSQSYNSPDAPKTYTTRNFTVEQADSQTEIKNYSAALSAAISIPPAQNERYELSVFEDFANSNDAGILSSLSLNIARYQKIISRLLSIPVPEMFIVNHVALINGLSEMVFYIQKMQSFPTDPVGGLNAVSDYDTASKNMVSALDSIIVTILANGGTFSAAH